MQEVANECLQRKASADIAEKNTTGTLPNVAVPFAEPKDPVTHYLLTASYVDLEALPDGAVRTMVILQRVNDVPFVNQFFRTVNRKLGVGDFFIGCVETSEQLKRRILSTSPRWVGWLIYVGIFLTQRVLPKLGLTRNLYLLLMKGRQRVMAKAEVLGRLVYCGFEILDHVEADGQLHFIVRKKGLPVRATDSPCGLIFKMHRLGLEGRLIQVYKLRTMHPYSEYLQEYICAMNNLQPCGKFNDDFRIATWGRFIRRTWLDELPMLFNVLKGDLKVVGVRPLSEQYATLYPVDLLRIRSRQKPGLIPPYYADMPSGFDELLASEIRYLQAYEERPFATDVRYFLRATYNILIKRVRSQ